MSFSSETKAELCKVAIGKRCCALAEAYGILLYCNLFTPRAIKIVTSCRELGERLPKLFRRAFGFGIDTISAQDTRGREIFEIDDAEHIREIFSAFGGDANSFLAHHINLGVLEDSCCRAAFLRGAFLAGGSITDPAKSYHLELVTDHMSVSRESYALLLDMGFFPKDASRSGNYIVYFKQSEAIEDFLTMAGAPLSAMEIMSAKVEKDMRNAVNRRVNCDSANADKIVSAAQEQLLAIKQIEKARGLHELPEKLRETALLRIANPEASLAELAILAMPTVSKSCMSHRMRKLMELIKCD